MGNMMSLMAGGGAQDLGGSGNINFMLIAVVLLVSLGVLALVLTRNWTTLVVVLIMLGTVMGAASPAYIASLGLGMVIVPLVVIPVVFASLFILTDKMPARRTVAIGSSLIGAYLAYIFMSSMGFPSVSNPSSDSGGSAPGGGIPGREVFGPLNQSSDLPILVILILSIIALLIWARTHQWMEARGQEDTKEEIEEDISSTVDTAIKDLHTGKDVRSSIMRCYQKMCNILEESGISNEKSMTPREFRTHADEKLGVSTSRIDDLTDLFEEARYSSHSLSERDRDRALNNLKALKKGLGD